MFLCFNIKDVDEQFMHSRIIKFNNFCTNVLHFNLLFCIVVLS